MMVWLHEPKNRTRLRSAMIVGVIVIAVAVNMKNTSLGLLALSAYQNLANVSSLSAQVPPNEYNTLALQFDQKDKELNSRERELLLREQSLDAKVAEAAAANKRMTIIVLGAVTTLLLLLILLNFYFDVKREETREEKSDDKSHPEFSTKL